MTACAGSGPRVPLARPHLGEEEIAAVSQVLATSVLTNGDWTKRFEELFAARHQVSHAVAVANGTVALAAMYLALDIGPGDEVIVPSLTFVSSATSVQHVGATPVFADVLEDTFTLDPADVRRRITGRTRAILAVHYGGQAADLAELAGVAEERRILLLEDAAQAHGASYSGRPLGGFGKAAIFSFTPSKNITTGEGGMVTTNDDDLAARVRLLRNHGQTDLYRHEFLGYNWRISEVQAAIGVAQMAKLDAILERKRANAEWMTEQLAELPGVRPPATRPDRDHPYMLYTVTFQRGRDHVMRRLLDAGIESRIYFPPVHRQPIFAEQRVELPVTESLAERILSIPVHSLLSDDELELVVSTVRDAVLELEGPTEALG
jgi:perosamine synthetase